MGINKKAEDPVAVSGGWSWSMLNPFSSWRSNGSDRFHDFFVRLLPGHPKAAWLTEKSIDAALLGAALMGTARGIKWLYDAGESASGPAKKIHKQVGTTFRYGKAADKRNKRRKDDAVQDDDEALDKQAYERAVVQRPAETDVWQRATNALWPAAFLLGAGALAFTAVDNVADKARMGYVKHDLKRNSDKLRRLIETRARLAKGNATDQEVEQVLADTEDTGYVKTAGFREYLGKAVKGIGKFFGDTASSVGNELASNGPGKSVRDFAAAITLLTLGTGVATAIGSYTINKKRDKNNIEYKAYERGLQEYARLKAGMTPLTISPDAGMLARIDAPGAGTKGKERRCQSEEPEASATHRPMMLTLD